MADLELMEAHPLVRRMRRAFGPAEEVRAAFEGAVPQVLLSILERLESDSVAPWHLQGLMHDLAEAIPPLMETHKGVIEEIFATVVLHPSLPDFAVLAMSSAERAVVTSAEECPFAAGLLDWLVEVVAKHPAAYRRIHQESEAIRNRIGGLGLRYRALRLDEGDPPCVQLDALFDTVGRLIETGYKPYVRFVADLAWFGTTAPKGNPMTLGQWVRRAREGLESNYPAHPHLIDDDLVHWRNCQAHDDYVYDADTRTLRLESREWVFRAGEAELWEKLQEVDQMVGLDGGFHRALLAFPYRMFGPEIRSMLEKSLRESQSSAHSEEVLAARQRFLDRVQSTRVRAFLTGCDITDEGEDDVD